MPDFNTLINSLSGRLIALITVALLPLGLISIYQTQAVVDEAQELSRTVLLSETLAAASREQRLIGQALGAAQGLGAAILETSPDQCDSVLSTFVDGHPEYVFAGYLDASGALMCSSTGDRGDYSDVPSFQRAVERRTAFVEADRRGRITQRSVILAGQPVFENSELLGFVTISIPHDLANNLMRNADADGRLKLASINKEGELISATRGLDVAPTYLPKDIPLTDLFDRTGDTFAATAGDGSVRYFAVNEMVEDNLVLVGSWTASGADLYASANRARWSMIFPLLMWCVGIVVAYLGLQRLVIRHVRALRSGMRRFALGDRSSMVLQLENPPEELADTQRAFNRMALIISQAEEEKAADLQDKEVLLREVHHRVKNNLQLIASIMNMQSRNARSPEAKSMLAGLQRRVRGLAVLHRSLYTTPDMTTVNSAELVETVVADIVNLSTDRHLAFETDLASVLLYPDQAVPLSMLMAEALTNAIKYCGAPSGETPKITVTLSECDDGLIEIVVENSRGDEEIAEDDTLNEIGGLGARLMRAFVSQLDGKYHVEDTETRYTLRVTFPRRDFPIDRPNAA